MFGKKTFLNTDQGIRALWLAVNEIFICKINEWSLYEWLPTDEFGSTSEDGVTSEIENLKRQSLAERIVALADSLASFDWRTSTAPGLSTEQIMIRKGFKGSGGYVDLKRLLLEHVSANCRDSEVADAALTALQ